MTCINTSRFGALDLLRGLAVLGILFANIPSFGNPWYETQLAAIANTSTGLDAVVDAIRTTFVSGKFRSILAIVFGFGLYLQFEKRQKEGSGWPGGYVKRMLVLALLGLAHVVTLWMGDILFTYAITCLICMWFLYIPEKTLRILVAVGFGLVTLGAILFAVLMGLLESLIPDALSSMDKEFSAQIEVERKVFIGEGYLQQALFRIQSFFTEGVYIAFFGIALAPLFLFGALLAKAKILTNPELHLSTYRKLQWWALGVGIPMNLLGLLFLQQGTPLWLKMLVELAGGPLVAVGVVISVVLNWNRLREGLVAKVFGKVGKVALSCYILQSLIATSIFYSWGGGLYEKLSQAQLVLVALAIDAVLVVLALLWSRTGKLGPIEWLFRKLSGDLRKKPQIAFQL